MRTQTKTTAYTAVQLDKLNKLLCEFYSNATAKEYRETLNIILLHFTASKQFSRFGKNTKSNNLYNMQFISELITEMEQIVNLKNQ